MDDRVTATEPLHLERTGAILRVTLDRPDRANALNAAIVDNFLAMLNDRAALADLRVLVIDGNGANFCGGFDLSQIDTIDEAALIVRILRLETLLQRIYHAPFVTIAYAQGNAIGAGADLFAACAYRIADPNARFRMPGWQFAIALGTKRLCDRVGVDTARDMLGTNRKLVATEALGLGLATAVVERAAWHTLIDELVARTGDLSVEARAQLHRLSVTEHRDEDMAALVASALRTPSLKARMMAYVRTSRLRARPPSHEQT